MVMTRILLPALFAGVVGVTAYADVLAGLATLTLTSGGEAIDVRVVPQTGRVQVQ